MGGIGFVVKGEMMGHRLSKIYTRTGDKGTTSVGRQERLDKDHILVEVFGDVDELSSAIGVVLSDQQLDKNIRHCLLRVQNELFDWGGELCLPEHPVISAEHVTSLEHELDAFNSTLPYLNEFILPGGDFTAAMCHLARAICRRAERHCFALTKERNINPQLLIYLNRLSDLLFVIARSINKQKNVSEVQWKHMRN